MIAFLVLWAIGTVSFVVWAAMHEVEDPIDEEIRRIRAARAKVWNGNFSD